MPYRVVGGVRFYERREVRDALAYLRMLVNPDDEVSLRRILNVPKRGIGDRAVECVTSYAQRERITFWEGLRRADEAPGLVTPVAGGDPGLRRAGRGAPVDGRGGGAGRRGARVGARPVGLPRRARGLRRPPGRHPPGEPRRARRGRPRVLRRPGRRAVRRSRGRRRRQRLARPLRLPRAGRARRRHRPDPRRTARRRRRDGHADDAPHGQGPGVPDRVPDRARGRRLPPLAQPRATGASSRRSAGWPTSA